ncbi:MAG: TonB-dependent receptor [Ignavibacteriales bacterium]|nr:TonB-dependent receptor [Ignavibacteriales bacterium]
MIKHSSIWRQFALCLIIMQSGIAGTVGIIDGKVIDKNTKEPLPAVNVQIIGTMMGGVSDIEGLYQLNNIPAGTYDLRFSYVGYKTLTVRRVAVLADLRTRLDVVLEVSTVEMQGVEITARKPLIQKDQPSTAYSIGEIKLEKLPVTSFLDVLSLQPGVTLEGNVRGGKTNEVLFLIDGMPVQDYISGGLGSELPKSAIGGMTIMTGGFDAEYGNAMSAIVNVITRTGQNDHKINVRFEKDNWIPSKWVEQTDQLNELELTASGPLLRNSLFYMTAATIRLSNTRWWKDMQNFYPSPNNKEFSGITKLDFYSTSTTRLSLQAIYTLRDWLDYEFSWRYNLDGLPKRSRMSIRTALSFTKTLTSSTSFSLSLSRYYLKNQVGEGNKSDMLITPYRYDIFLRYVIAGSKNWWAKVQQEVYSLKGDYTSQLDKNHFLKFGFEVSQYDIFSDLVKFEPQRTYFGKTMENAQLLNYSNLYDYLPRMGSAFIQDKIQFSRDGSILSLGLRWDFMDPRAERPTVEFIPSIANPAEFVQHITGSKKAAFKQQFSPRIAFAAPTGPSGMFYVNFGYYFQFPLFDYLYSGITPAQIQSGSRSVMAGNPDLEPERTIAWELGYKHAIDEFFVGSVTYFQKNAKNQIDSKTLVAFDSKFAGDYGFATYVNNAEASASGIEFVLSRERDDKLSGSISYTYMITEGMSEVANQAVNQAQWGFPIKAVSFPLSWDQRHSVKLDVAGKMWYDVQANLVLWYNSAKPYTYFPTRDGFTAADSTKDFIPNNYRMKDVVFVNLKLSKSVTVAELAKIMVYADIRNLLNTKNVRWIDSNGRIGGELDDPSAYYDLRRVMVGVSCEF